MTENSEVNTGGGLVNSGNATAGRDFIGRDKWEFNILSDDGNEYVQRLIAGMRNDKPNPKTLFIEHIEPTYKLMDVVQKDYERALQNLRERIDEDSVDARSLLKWFQSKSLDYRSEREFLKNTDSELDVVISRFVDNAELRSFLELVREFSQSISEYFYLSQTSTIFHLTIFRLKELVDMSNDSEKVSILDVKRDLSRWIDSTLDYELPNKWNRIIRIYRKLRGMSLAQ